MANKYQDFKTFYTEELNLNVALNAARGGSKDAQVRQVAASLFTNPNTTTYRNYLLHNPNVQKDEFVNVLTIGFGAKKKQVDTIVADLEALVNDMDKGDVMVGLSIVPPKIKYVGPKAAVYTAIKTAGKKTEEMAKVINSNNFNEMYKQIKASENTRLASVDANQKALCDALIDAKGNFVQELYHDNFNDAKTAFATALKGNEKGYLAANLSGKDFRKFYTDLENAKQNPGP